MDLSGLQEVLSWKKKLPGRWLVTVQCFTNALHVGNENGSEKRNIQFRWHTQTWTHLHTHSHNNGRRAKGQRVTSSSLTMGVVHLFLSTSWHSSSSLFFLGFLLISLWIKHFTTALPFCQNTFFLLLFIVFLLQNMYRLFRTTTKIQYPILCNFFCLIIINSLGESSLSFSSFWLFQAHCPKWPTVHVGAGGGRGLAGKVQINT